MSLHKCWCCDFVDPSFWSFYARRICPIAESWTAQNTNSEKKTKEIVSLQALSGAKYLRRKYALNCIVKLKRPLKRSFFVVRIDEEVSEREAEVGKPSDKETKKAKLDHTIYDYVSLRHLSTLQSDFDLSLPAETDREVREVMEDELVMMRAKAYASHPTIIEMHEKMAELPRCAKHGTVRYFFLFFI